MKTRDHNGGSCPTHPNAIVRIMLRGTEAWGSHDHEAGKLRWKHDGGAGDIVRWAFMSGPDEVPETQSAWTPTSGGY